MEKKSVTGEQIRLSEETEAWLFEGKPSVAIDELPRERWYRVWQRLLRKL